VRARDLILLEARKRNKQPYWVEPVEPDLATYFSLPWDERVAGSEEFLDPEYEPHKALQDLVPATGEYKETELREPGPPPKPPKWSSSLIQAPPSRPPQPRPSPGRQPKHSWAQVDWSQPNIVIARALGTSSQVASNAR